MDSSRWQQVKGVLGDALEIEERQARAAFVANACADDTALLREVDSLLAARSSDKLEGCASELSVGSIELADQSIGQRIGSYRIVRDLGRGGMGAVYLAERADQEFTKQVAVKLLKRGTDTDEVLRRFRSEREILARLEHPNIARLLDAGTADDGLPYFVMEYVVGSRVNDYCFAQNLSIADRIRLFLKICSAVHFAHQNLVIHRDLKPANILITADGEPKLLDFGIAKLVAADEGAFQMTLQDQQRLTPAYASPEQVRGEVITTVSDVYSLGALLYELLVGHSPHRFVAAHPTPTELWRVVGEQTPPRPSAAAHDTHVARKLRGDLDNILLTALRKEPARRYSGVGAFSEDLRRYLENKPVHARPATIAYRAGKFISRNKAAAMAAALAIVALLAGTGMSVWNAQRATSEARRAARNFEDVRQLASSFLFEFHDAIASLPGATDARRLVVSRALEYLGKLALQARDDQPLALDLAQAYLRVGDVQGKPYTPNLGDSDGALQSYERAIAIVAPLAASERGTDVAARRLLGQAFASKAAVQSRLRRLEDATTSNTRALEIGEQLRADDPAHADEWNRLIVAGHLGLGDAVESGNHEHPELALLRAALGHYERALPLAEQLAASHPESMEDLRRLAKNCARIAGLLVEVGAATADRDTFRRAFAFHERTKQLNETALAREPGNAQLQRNLADGLVSSAYARVVANEDLSTAAADIMRALEIEQALAAADRSNIEAGQDLSFAHYVSGRVFLAMGDQAAAAEHYRACITILEPLVRANPSNAETAFDLSRARRGLAEIAGRVPAAGAAKERSTRD